MRRRFAACALATALLAGGPGLTDAWAQFSHVSVAHDGGSSNGNSSGPTISADGRFVTFSSDATNLVTDDTNAATDVFVRDRQTNVTTRISLTSAGLQASGTSASASMTPDGRFVAFVSGAALVPTDTVTCPAPAGPTCSDVYIHDRQAPATTIRVSLTSTGAEPNGNSYGPTVSADGRYVVFVSDATNLVPDDTNGLPDVFLRDRQTNTTTRISLNADGSQMPRGGGIAAISHNAEVIVFSGRATPQEVTDPSTCDTATSTCLALYLRHRETGVTTRLSDALPSHGFTPGAFQITTMYVRAMSGDGRYIAIQQSGILVGGTPGKSGRSRTLLHDRVTNSTTHTTFLGGYLMPTFNILDVSDDGSTYASEAGFNALFSWYQRITDVFEAVTIPGIGERTVATSVDLSGDGRFAAFVTTAAVLGSDTNETTDLYVYDRDVDEDGLPGAWETLFGLNPALATDAGADPDNDGFTNLQEFQRGSHPLGTQARYFAEGAANAFFETRYAALNPGDAPARVVFRYLGRNGQRQSDIFTLNARSRVSVDAVGGAGNDFSVLVESDQPVVVDRLMMWGQDNLWGGHAETSIAAPSTTWYLAEGATHGAFDLFYLFQNPNPTEATVTVNYLRLDPATPVVKTYHVPANSRETIWVDEEAPELAAVDVGASITSDLPIVVERAMYSTRPGQPAFAAGHGGAGVTTPAPKWFLAEGSTGQFFDMYVLIANPNAAPSEVKVTYLLDNSDESFSKTLTVGAQSRKTLSIKDEDPRLADTVVSMIVETTNNQPLVVERSMWWPKDQWYEAHLSAGATTTGTRWALAEGEVSDNVVPAGEAWETYILIANTSSTPGSATVTLIQETGNPITHTVQLPANSRVNVPVSTLYPFSAQVEYRRFGAIVESDVQIVVERAMYRNVDGVPWAIGTVSLATKLQ